MKQRRTLLTILVLGLLVVAAMLTITPTSAQESDPGDHDPIDLDIVLLIDNSTGMGDTDPEGLRLETAREYVAALERHEQQDGGSHRVAVATFAEFVSTDYWAPLSDLPSDAVDNAIFEEYVLGSDFRSPMKWAIDELGSRNMFEIQGRRSIVILFTDGRPHTHNDAMTDSQLDTYFGRQSPDTWGDPTLYPDRGALASLVDTLQGADIEVLVVAVGNEPSIQRRWMELIDDRRAYIRLDFISSDSEVENEDEDSKIDSVVARLVELSLGSVTEASTSIPTLTTAPTVTARPIATPPSPVVGVGPITVTTTAGSQGIVTPTPIAKGPRELSQDDPLVRGLQYLNRNFRVFVFIFLISFAIVVLALTRTRRSDPTSQGTVSTSGGSDDPLETYAIPFETAINTQVERIGEAKRKGKGALQTAIRDAKTHMGTIANSFDRRAVAKLKLLWKAIISNSDHRLQIDEILEGLSSPNSNTTRALYACLIERWCDHPHLFIAELYKILNQKGEDALGNLTESLGYVEQVYVDKFKHQHFLISNLQSLYVVNSSSIINRLTSTVKAFDDLSSYELTKHGKELYAFLLNMAEGQLVVVPALQVGVPDSWLAIVDDMRGVFPRSELVPECEARLTDALSKATSLKSPEAFAAREVYLIWLKTLKDLHAQSAQLHLVVSPHLLHLSGGSLSESELSIPLAIYNTGSSPAINTALIIHQSGYRDPIANPLIPSGMYIPAGGRYLLSDIGLTELTNDFIKEKETFKIKTRYRNYGGSWASSDILELDVWTHNTLKHKFDGNYKNGDNDIVGNDRSRKIDSAIKGLQVSGDATMFYVLGQSKLGKTVSANRIVTALKSEGHECAIFDCSPYGEDNTIRDEGAFWLALAKKIWSFFIVGKGIPPDMTSLTGSNLVKQLLNHPEILNARKSRKLLIVLEDSDTLNNISISKKRKENIRGKLDQIIQDSNEWDVKLLFTMREYPDGYEINSNNVVQLELLSESDIDEVLEHDVIKFSWLARKYMWLISGGHPYVLSLLRCEVHKQWLVSDKMSSSILLPLIRNIVIKELRENCVHETKRSQGWMEFMGIYLEDEHMAIRELILQDRTNFNTLQIDTSGLEGDKLYVLERLGVIYRGPNEQWFWRIGILAMINKIQLDLGASL